MQVNGPLLLVGGGKMGGALLEGWLDRGIAPEQVYVVEPDGERRQGLEARRVHAVAGEGDLSKDLVPAVVVLAVKPQMMDEVLPPYRRFAGPGTVFLSIAAGRTIASLTRHLGEAAAVVRAMPNTPAAVGRGISVLCANANVGDEQQRQCETLMQAVGETGWVEDEGLMDAVTGVSGSGPAYVFLLMECLAEAGVEAGLPADLAQRLAMATVAGAGELARRSGEEPAQLRRNVTSPGGTTQAALDVLMAEDGLKPLMVRAVAAAKQRGRELAG